MKTTYEVEFYSKMNKEWTWLEDKRTLKAAGNFIKSEKRRDALSGNLYEYRVIAVTTKIVPESEWAAK